MKKIFPNKFIRFVVLFLLLFLCINHAVKFLIGIAVPGGIYISFVDKYLNIAHWMRSSLLNATSFLLQTIHIPTVRVDEYILRVVNGRGIKIIYACLGVAVLSFWAAFVLVNQISFLSKLKWLIGGLLIIWCINVLRISLVLYSNFKGWHFPFGWDHHTWFNIIAYLVIFLMMYFFQKNINFNDEGSIS